MTQVDSHNSIQRLLVGGLAFLLTFLVIYFSNTSFGHYLLFAVMCGVVTLSLMEFYSMTKTKGHEPITWLGIASSLILLCLTLPPPSSTFFSYIGVLLLTLFISYLLFFNQGRNPLTNLSITLFGICYLSIPLSFILLINKADDARIWLLYLLVVTKMTDIFAYFVGKKWKKTLAPMISPKKTIEGAIGGFVVAVLSSICFYYFFHNSSPTFTFTLLDSIVLGGVISILAQIGDLAESLLKRDAGIKDSNSLPGLGGMLDIMDSLIFTSPALYYYLVLSH